ncbi:phage tail protein, partial [Mannheimia haemolytica]|nr:phage tail protein [Mannheimia haemolytica]MDW0393326.1 phage tail protein [Mannheimia haemolytica]MDW0665486.1 phage tail protein [Mannheimia haemolytica]MDW1053962.1 phage tail protein [Mannheimia haemolytica]MDW1084735.1 phage tail protein [Mannheimia haemolytica]
MPRNELTKNARAIGLSELQFSRTFADNVEMVAVIIDYLSIELADIRFALRLDNIQGKANPFLFARRLMLEEASDNVTDITQPSPWQNAGVTAIHGGSIATNTVTAQQIAANTITANEIAAGTIAARNMAANSINASHIVGSSITADKLNVNNLAAISANLGKVTAGTITGTTISGGTISGT